MDCLIFFWRCAREQFIGFTTIAPAQVQVLRTGNAGGGGGFGEGGKVRTLFLKVEGVWQSGQRLAQCSFSHEAESSVFSARDGDETLLFPHLMGTGFF